MYRSLIFKRVAVKRQGRKSTRIVTPAMATRVTCLIANIDLTPLQPHKAEQATHESISKQHSIATDDQMIWWCRLMCHTHRYLMFNSLTPGRSGFHFKKAIFNLALLIGNFRSSYDDALRWMPMELTSDKSIFVQVMAWYHLSKCWPRSTLPYGITRPQWVKKMIKLIGIDNLE